MQTASQTTSRISEKPVVFRQTNAHKGRNITVTPENSAMNHLYYGRIILDKENPVETFETENREVGLICLSGAGTVRVDETLHELSRYDAIYVPPNCTVEVSTSSAVDFVECAAEIEGNYPLQVVRYAEAEQNPALKFQTGGESSKRTINILLGKNIQAGRILAGVTTSEPGHWTSFPPHEHAAMLEELYVYYDMPPPAFGIQLVYTNTDEPEVVTIVKDGDAILMPKGYHPNVSVPGFPINFVWIMAANKEVEDRQFGVVNVQPGFDGGKSGLEASLK